VNEFIDQTVILVEKLGKVVTTVLRIYPSSPIETSSNSFRDQILSMAYDLMTNGHELFEADKAFMDQDEFYEDIFRRVYGRTKRVGLKGGPLYKHLYPQAFWFGFSLLGELASSKVALSSDLKEFADYMKVKTSEELSVVRQSMTIFAEDLKYWGTQFSRESVYDTGTGPLYKHELMCSIEGHFVNFSYALGELINDGLPKIEEDFKEAQKVEQTESLMLLTVATLFSSITASTIGFSFQQTSRVFHVVNFF